MRWLADARQRARSAVGRVVRAPGAARRRHAELVRRDDVEHHLLSTLLDRVDEQSARLAGLDALTARVDHLGARCDGLAGQLDRLAASAASSDAEQRRVAHALEEAVADLTTDVAIVAASAADLDPPDRRDGPLVTVVMPAWNRASVLGTAISSVRQQTYRSWELVVVDDGSTDATAEVAERHGADDERVRCVRVAHGGVAAARNHGLAAARGDIVAYLDTDNVWHPTHLARVVTSLGEAPEAQWCHSGQVVVDPRTGRAHLRRDLRTTDTLAHANYIDLNTVAHRRSAIDEIGRFDTELTRLVDWDLVVRLADLGEPARVAAATVTYRVDVPGRISDIEPMYVQQHQLRQRYRGRPAEGLRILFAQWHFLQITETYIAALAHGLARLGAEVEVWADVDASVNAPTDLVVHRGTLEEAIDEHRPDLVLTHWLNKGVEYRPVTREAGLPHAVLTHGFDYQAGWARELLSDDDVVVHTFPHLVEPDLAEHPRLSTWVTCFDEQRYHPVEDKDRRMVLRTSAGLFTKDLETFMLTAGLCPDHRFVLVIGHSLLVEERTEALVERAAELGSPCEILLDRTHEQMSELMAEAGIYLHTHGTDHPVGMPISIAESLATGCYVLARRLPGIEGYVGAAGALYDGATPDDRARAAARLVQDTTSWSDERWRAVQQSAAERAYRSHASTDVALQLVRTWQATFPELAARGRRGS